MRRTPALLALALLLAVPAAGAHAVPIASEPAQGARLAEPPTRATVTFSEPFERSASWIRVEDADGSRVDLDDLSFPSDVAMAISVRPDLPDGVYTIHWRTFGKDTHTLDSHIGFAVGAYDAPAGGGVSYEPGAQAIAGRALAFAGLALAFGAAAWMAWLASPQDPSRRTLARRALALGAALHLAGLVLLVRATAETSDLSLPELLASSVGKVFAVRLVLGAAALLLAALALVARNPSRSGPAVAVGLLVLAAIGSAQVSHSAKAGVPGVAIDAMHLLPAATWVGALALLAATLRPGAGPSDPDAVRRLGVRFGTLALACVVLLFLAGVLATAVVLGREALLDPAGLLATEYGRFLAAKVGLAAAMVGLAAVNRFAILRPGRPGVRLGLRRVVAAEASLGALVLVLAGVLTATSPTAADLGGGPAAWKAEADGEAFHYVLAAEPAPRFGGESRLTMSVFDRETGEPVTENDCGRASCVELRIGPAGGSGDDATGEAHAMLPDGSGRWVLDGALWSFRGPAVAHVRMQTGGDVFQDEADLRFEVAE
jgi:copper transport protein